MSDITTFLKQLSSDEIYYIANPGNGGDSVIAAATHQVFSRAGLRVIAPHPDNFDPAGKIVIYAGGANFVGKTTASYPRITRLHSKARRFIILPHTIRNVDEALEQFGGNVQIICRERVSYDYVRACNRSAEVLLMDDMAFSLDIQQLSDENKWKNIPLYFRNSLIDRFLKEIYPPSIREFLTFLSSFPVRYRLNHRWNKKALECHRLDSESTGRPIPEGNVDLSQVFQYGTSPKAAAFLAAQAIVETLSQFEEIRTDRLHLAIPGALLGKQVKFHPNNYYKIRAVYEYSMKDRFENVQWMEE